MQESLKALGRLKAGEMNKTEERFSRQVLAPALLAGDILDWRFEAFTLVLPGGVRYTPDFFVMLKNQEMRFIEIKGSAGIFADDAKAKFRIAAGHFPMFSFVSAAPVAAKRGGGWSIIYGDGKGSGAGCLSTSL